MNQDVAPETAEADISDGLWDKVTTSWKLCRPLQPPPFREQLREQRVALARTKAVIKQLVRALFINFRAKNLLFPDRSSGYAQMS
jgi:hypothetical protein